MKLCRGSSVACLWGAAAVVQAAEFMHLDGVDRIAKEAEITQRAVLVPRDGDSCAKSLSLCPSSLNGGCCPDGYECGKNSCFATTRGPATCGTLVGWYACAAVHGGGCCPDGYMCQAGQDCIPPSGSPYTFDCPASHYLCPESLSYGCCPDGMGCAINQCYSTESQTITTEITVTTTEDGERTTYTTRSTTVKEPDIPTELPEVGVDDDEEQRVLKYFPSAVPKEDPTSDGDDDNDGDSGLTTAELAGIVTGAVGFLIIVVAAAFIIIRHLNKVVAAVSDSRQSGTSSRVRPAMKEFKPTDSEIDVLSIDPLMMSPRVANPRANSTPGTTSSTDLTPSSFAGAYQAVSTAANSTSRHQSWESGGMSSYFDYVPGRNARFSQSSAGNRVSQDSQGTYQHVRHWSNASDGSNDMNENPVGRSLAQELEANTVGPELPGSPTSQVDEDQRRRSSGGGSVSSVISRPPPSAHQRVRNGTVRGHELAIVDEEAHGYHGPRNRMAGQTARPSSRDSWREGDDGSR